MQFYHKRTCVLVTNPTTTHQFLERDVENPKVQEWRCSRSRTTNRRCFFIITCNSKWSPSRLKSPSASDRFLPTSSWLWSTDGRVPTTISPAVHFKSDLIPRWNGQVVRSDDDGRNTSMTSKRFTVWNNHWRGTRFDNASWRAIICYWYEIIKSQFSLSVCFYDFKFNAK